MTDPTDATDPTDRTPHAADGHTLFTDERGSGEPFHRVDAVGRLAWSGRPTRRESDDRNAIHG